MPDLTTPNYAFTEPTVNADNNVWGGLLNADIVSLDQFVGVPAPITQSPTVGATVAVDITKGVVQSFTVSQATTVTLSGATANVAGGKQLAQIVYLVITNGGAFTVSWAATGGTIVWAGPTAGIVPTLKATGTDVVAFWTFDNGVTWYGLQLAPPPSALPPVSKVNYFQTPGAGTYTPSAGCRAFEVLCVGGGGAGGGTTNTATAGGAAGGGAGGVSRKYVTGTLKGSYGFVVGAAGVAASGAAGGAGGDTTFDSASICTGKGGAGGSVFSGSVALGGAGGDAIVGAIGDLKGNGGAGRDGGPGLAGAGGGSSALGGGAPSVFPSNTGVTAKSLGAGGGGAYTNGGLVHTGGGGQSGAVIVVEYF